MTQIKAGDRVRHKFAGIVLTVIAKVPGNTNEWECHSLHGVRHYLKECNLESLTDPELKAGDRVRHPSGQIMVVIKHSGDYVSLKSESKEIYCVPAASVEPLSFTPIDILSAPDQVDVKEQQGLLDRYYEQRLKELHKHWDKLNNDELNDVRENMIDMYGAGKEMYEYVGLFAMTQAQALLTIRNQNLVK